MMLDSQESAEYANAVQTSAERFLDRHGHQADLRAWSDARRPTLTHSERAYCEAVARRVSQVLAHS